MPPKKPVSSTFCKTSLCGGIHMPVSSASSEALVRAYRQEADRQKLLVKKHQITQTRLLFVVSALKKLFSDENFLTLLRAEGLDTLPAYLAERIQTHEGPKHE